MSAVHALLSHSRALQQLELRNMPNLKWEPPPQGAPLPSAPRLTSLIVDNCAVLGEYLPLLLAHAPHLQHLRFSAPSSATLGVLLSMLRDLPALTTLGITNCEFRLPSRALAALGRLRLTELAIDADSHTRHRTSAVSHLNDKGVIRLVDMICQREAYSIRGPIPLHLSLRGAKGLTRSAAAALLRLPLLAELDITGCSNIPPADRLRLVSKVKVGHMCRQEHGLLRLHSV
eukprot:jgi/Tetstr1/454618/TSEL_041510.t1